MSNTEHEIKFAVNEETLKITKELINWLERSTVHTSLTKEVLRSNVGYKIMDRDLSDYLIRISDICQELNLPYITAIVYEQDGIPGDELFKYHFPGTGKAERTRIIKTCIEQVTRMGNWDVLLQHMRLV